MSDQERLKELERRKKALELWKLRRSHLMNFTEFTMPKYQTNWHHELICHYIMEWIFGTVDKLAIFTPPRHGKSEIVSRRTPPFILGHFPWAQIVIASYGDTLASGMNIAAQRIMTDEKYLSLFPDSAIPEKGSSNDSKKKRKDSFVELLNHEGSIRSTGVGGTLTGQGANFLIIDDPFKNELEAYSETTRERVYNWWQATAETRLETPGKVLLTMTRWHDDDLAGRLLEEDAEGWTVLNLPALATTTRSKGDPRSEGDALWPAKWPVERLLKKKKTTPAAFWEAMYQQDPIIGDGGLFKREWWKFYRERPKDVKRIITFWDTAQKAGISNDNSVAATWAETDTGFFCLHRFKGKLEAPELERTVKNLYAELKPNGVMIEDKSSGSSLIQTLRRETTIPVIAYDPGRLDKEVRALAATPTVEAGNCYLPEGAEWVEDFILEHERFPNSKYRDQVDTTSMMVEYFNKPARQLRIRAL